MRTNPVYKRETMVSSRSLRFTMIMLVFNGILAFVTLLNMYSALEQVKRTAVVQYSSFLDLYIFVAALEFVMILFIMPALTAGSISGERERRTLDLMLTTKLTPAQIVAGKLTAAFSTMSLMVVSSFPILALVFVYGGVTFVDILLLFLSYLTAALYVGSLGICCSAVCRKTVAATVLTYAGVAFAVIGTFAVNWFSVYMDRMRADSLAGTEFFAERAASGSSLTWLFLWNPASQFLMAMRRLAGGGQTWSALYRQIGMADTTDPRVWIWGSSLAQLLMAAIFTRAAVRALTPAKGGGKHHGVNRV